MNIDINTLDAATLVALQKQLKALAKAKSGDRAKRNEIIDTMIATRATEGDGFEFTTREIATRLSEAGVGIDASLLGDKEEMAQEIRRIQARKQLLEKATDKKGELVHPKGSFGYRSSGGVGAGLAATKVKPDTVLAFFEAGRASELTKEQVDAIKAAIGGVK